MSIKQQITDLNSSLPKEVTLVAVSKTHPAEDIIEAYEIGQRVFGESRPQELCAKWEQLPKDIEWHMIGHLQTNKVRSIITFVSLIHSVDSLRLLNVINSEAKRCGRIVDVLLEVYVACEETKHGWSPGELLSYLESGEYKLLQNVRFRGVMGIASYTDDMDLVTNEFMTLNNIFINIRERFFGSKFDALSMGMTSDYQLAIEHGSNMVRIGSLIFGSRTYTK